MNETMSKVTTIPAISSSRLKCWRDNREEYFLRYVCNVRTQQTWPMAVGTVFDKLVKEELARVVKGVTLGKGYCGELSSRWVGDPVKMKELLTVGQRLLREYLAMGGLQDGLRLVKGVGGAVGAYKVAVDADLIGDVQGVAICGKPDWIVQGEELAVLDWKVSVDGESPRQGWNAYSLKPLMAHAKADDKDTYRRVLWDWYTQGWFYRKLVGTSRFSIHQILGGGKTVRYARWIMPVWEDLDQEVEADLLGLSEAIANGRIWTDLSEKEDFAKQEAEKAAWCSGDRREEWMQALGVG